MIIDPFVKRLAALGWFVIATLYLGCWKAPNTSVLPVQNKAHFTLAARQPIREPDAYTIIMATFRRDECLKKSVTHYLKCNMLELRIKWQDFNRSVPDWLWQVQSDNSGRLVIDVADADYLSSRFKVDRLQTEAVFPVDDDVRHPCFYLRDGFRIWQRTPSQIVGFAPRRVVAGGGCYRLPSVWRNIYYPIINTMWVTKGAFLHRDYLKVYFSQDYAHLRNLVDGNLTGEDMLMSFIVALANPPGQRWPVTLLSRKSPDDKKCSTLALGNAGMAKRCNLLDYFFYVLGFPMEFTPFSEIYTYDKSRSIFVPLSDKLRMKWVLHGQSPIEPV